MHDSPGSPSAARELPKRTAGGRGPAPPGARTRPLEPPAPNNTPGGAPIDTLGTVGTLAFTVVALAAAGTIIAERHHATYRVAMLFALARRARDLARQDTTL
jgi:hypothetical protein